LAAGSDGRQIYDVAPTINTLGSLLREWLARHGHAAWITKHGQAVGKVEEQDQVAVGKWISVGRSEERTPRHCVLLARL
jgi:hypothetical protein